MIKSVFVRGIPEGQERPRFAQGHFFSPKNAWWKAVNLQTMLIRPQRLLAGPLAVHVVYHMPRPRSSPAWVIWCPQKPDIDNIDKATFDAITGTREKPGRWWKDDKQIVHAVTEKQYAPAGQGPGAYIEVREIVEEEIRRKLPQGRD